MSLSQKVAFNTVVQIVSKIITVGFTLLTTILLTGYLGKESFGDYMYVVTLVIIFGALADWGTATIGVRELAKGKNEQGKLLGNIIILRLVLSCLAVLVLLFFSFFLPLQTQDPLLVRRIIRIFSLIIFLIAIKASFGIVFQSRLEMEKAAAADITTSFLIFLFSFYVVKKGFGLGPLIWAMIWASFAGVLVAAFFAIKTTKIIFQIDKKIISKIISEALPMGAILLMFTIDNKIDTVMLGAFKGSGAVGIYGIAYRVYDVLILGAAFLMNALLPVISRYADLKKWQTKLQQIYQKSFDVLLLMGVGVAALVWWSAPLVVQILTQKRFAEFVDAIWVLRILALAMLIAYFNHLTGYTIVALGKQRPYFLVALVALIFNVVANLLIIPMFSYFGAAVVTILTEVLVFLITTVFIFKLLKIVPSFLVFPKTLFQLIKQKGKLF